ncbi:MAG: MBL fold metallo-hydrolase [Brumimicrobium sp.]|nr:MBL fold metallo-hydrolase [Brumimicrobium sp.]
MKHPLKVKVLGSGTSQGVPVIGCQCRVCNSSDPRDKRLRSSILFSWNEENFVIDTGPDFREQMLRENISSLRAIIYTHEHKDHVAGMDDVRAFNFIEKRDMELFCTQEVSSALKRDFHYAFEKNKYPGVPNVNINLIDDKPFRLPDGPLITPVQLYHYRMPVKGFRIGDFAYLTDLKTIDNEELNKLKGVNYLILDCLRETPHISHLNMEEALELIEVLQPRKTYLTHISHLFDTHEGIIEKLPKSVEPAFDGLSFIAGDAD